MLDGCRTFVEKHAKDPAADPDNLSTARYDVIRALVSLGHFTEARPLAEMLLADSNDWDEELQALMREWPEE